jgi:hypothetical protein
MKKQNLKREIAILSRIDHSNVIKLIKVIETKYHVKSFIVYIILRCI